MIALLVALLSVQESLSFTQVRFQHLVRVPSQFRNRVFAAEPDIETTSTVPPDPEELDDEDDLTEAPLVIKTKRSLYEILRAPRNATKAELKVQYVALARETHPDALIGTNSSIDTSASFSEVAEAWKILSNPRDRRRYDRSLQTEAFAGNIEVIAVKVSEQAGPSMMKMFEKVAVPFLRRTAVTAVASFSAAAGDIIRSNGTKIDFGHAVSMAVKAGEAAGRIVDGMEALEKNKELEERAMQEQSQVIIQDVSKLPEFVDNGKNLSATSAFRALLEAEQGRQLEDNQPEVSDSGLISPSIYESIILDETLRGNTVPIRPPEKPSSALQMMTVDDAERTMEIKGKLSGAIDELMDLTSAYEKSALDETVHAKRVQAELSEVIDELMKSTSVKETKALDKTERAIEVQSKLLGVIDELVDETERAMEVQAKLSEVIDELMKASHDERTAASDIYESVTEVQPQLSVVKAESENSPSSTTMMFAEDSVRVKDMQRKLSEVIEELISSASEIEMTALDERKRAMEAQAKLSDVIDGLLKSTSTRTKT